LLLLLLLLPQGWLLLQGWLLHQHLSLCLSLVFSPNPLCSCPTVSNRCLRRLLLLLWGWLLDQ
jgi:hypothetical protein